jgi:tyrosyl-tRNA synthetase
MARQAAETARRTFEEGAIGEELLTVPVSASDLDAGIPLYRLLVDVQVSTSNGEARRLIQQGGARVNDRVVNDIAYTVRRADIRPDGFIKLTAGKKRHALLRVV